SVLRSASGELFHSGIDHTTYSPGLASPCSVLRSASGALFLKEPHSENTKDQLLRSWIYFCAGPLGNEFPVGGRKNKGLCSPQRPFVLICSLTRNRTWI
ncbi:hypothetical protein, partial [Muriicola sp.]|uniref:hypothetical protein n=1 Tax=Muriicola sp. TaxID=2020856 RepID=UPI00356430E3